MTAYYNEIDPYAAEFIRAFLSCEVTTGTGEAATKEEMSND